MRAMKSGFDHMFKSMTGIDIDELTAFGDQVGKLLVDFRDSLVRIEERIVRIEDQLGVDRRGGRIVRVIDPPGRPLER